MKFGVIKKVTKLFGKTKHSVIKHAPQIMAVAGAACLVGATVCAIKETPKAKEKLEEKKKLDPDMTMLQKAAVVAPEFKGTIALTAVGLGLEFGAWKVEADKVAKDLATAASIASAAIDGKKNYIETAKEIVGDDKAAEIDKEAKKKEGVIMAPYEEGGDANLVIPDVNRIVPVHFNLTDRTFFSTREKVEDAMEDLMEKLQEDGYLMLDTIVEYLYGGSCPIELGYSLEGSDGFGYSKAEAAQVLRYNITAWEDDFHRLGWYLEIIDDPGAWLR